MLTPATKMGESEVTASQSSTNAVNPSNVKDAEKAEQTATFRPTGRFWAIILTCATIGLLSALENTVVTTALPQIATELRLGTDYVWVTNIFFLAG